MDDLDTSSAFFFSLCISAALYIALFLSAPYISAFFGVSIVSEIRVVSVIVLISPLSSIQEAMIARRMQFRLLMFVTTVSTLMSGLGGIFLAYRGFGVWALVAQIVISRVVSSLLLLLFFDWRPTRRFSLARLRPLISFGWRMMGANFLGILFINIRSLLIGRFYDASSLGYYNRGRQFPLLIMSSIDTSLQSVLFPSYSSLQEDRVRLSSILRRSLSVSSFVVVPLMIGLAALAEQFVVLLLGKQWLPAVPFLKVYCAVYALMPIHSANIQVVKALGRSDLVLRLEFLKKGFDVVGLLIALQFGAFALAISELVTSVIALAINAWPTGRLIGYGASRQVRDLLPSFVLATAMGLAVSVLASFHTAELWYVILLVVAGIALYVAMTLAFRLESARYLVSIIREVLGAKRRLP